LTLMPLFSLLLTLLIISLMPLLIHYWYFDTLIHYWCITLHYYWH
jgi:hypothetical protein